MINFLANKSMQTNCYGLDFTEVNFSELARSFSILANNPHVPVDAIRKDTPLGEAFDTANLTRDFLLDTNYNYIHHIIDKLPKPKYIIPDTIASSLFDKYKHCSVAGVCSDLSISKGPKLKSKEFVVKDDETPDQIWVFKNSQEGYKVAALVVNNSKKAQIYIDANDKKHFRGFSTSELNLFRSKGVEYLELYIIGYPDHKLVIPKTSLNNAPLHHRHCTQYKNEKSAALRGILIVFAVILGLILLLMFFRKYKFVQ